MNDNYEYMAQWRSTEGSEWQPASGVSTSRSSVEEVVRVRREEAEAHLVENPGADVGTFRVARRPLAWSDAPFGIDTAAETRQTVARVVRRISGKTDDVTSLVEEQIRDSRYV